MNIKSLAICAISIAAMNSSVQAEEVFGGVSINSYDFKSNISEDLSPTGLSGRLGTYVAPNIALEVRAGFGIDEDDFSVAGVNSSLEVDKFWGTYLKPELAIADGIKAYGLLGYANVDAITKIGNLKFDVEDEGFSYGVGAELAFSDTVSGTVEYMQLLDEDNIDSSSIGFGVNVKF